MLQQTINQCEYLFDAWNNRLSENPNNKVLTDTLGNNLSRSDTDELSGKVYAWLKNNGIGKEDFVLINLDRSIKPIVAAIGVLKNASAFVIVESDYPAERIAFIKNDCNAKIEINEKNWPEIMATDSIEGYVRADDHDACLAIYTSGTTGKPKGVLHEYGQIKMEMLSEKEEDDANSQGEKRGGLIAPLNFIASVKIIIQVLSSGWHLYVLDYETAKNPKKLATYFLTHRINATFLSPSIIRLKGPDYGPFMRYIYTGAESANNTYVNKATLINTYSMSESFFTVTEFIVDKSYPICPIGLPRFDFDFRLVDEKGNDVADGEVGEIVYENPYCRGYLNNPVENEAHFKNGYFYTGDLAAFEDGLYYLKGRRDDMAKIDGNRIEPSEIEAACQKVLGIKQCVAKGFADKAAVVLYYVGKEKIDTDDAREKLKSLLPYYMIPSFFVHLDAIPLNKSFKTDRKALAFPSTLVRVPYVSPRDDFEKKLVDVFEKVLDTDKIGIDDDFYKLGGNSLRSMDVITRMDDDNLVSTYIYRGRTVRKISELYKNNTSIKLSDLDKELEGRKQRYELGYIEYQLWTYINNGSYDFLGAMELNPLIPLTKLEKIINEYIQTNSTFNLRIEDDNGTPVAVYSPEKYEVKVENVSKAEVDDLIKNFIRPFEYGEPLARIRLLKSGIHKYVFFHIAHVVTDAAGVHLMLEDIKNLAKGKEIMPARYFAFLYDQKQVVEPALYQEACQYYIDTIDFKSRMRNLVRDIDTGYTGYGRSRELRLDLDKIREVVPRYNGTISTYVDVITLFAENNYNNQPSYLQVIFDNRTPGENVAGLKFFTAGIGFSRDYESLYEVFDDINYQVSNVNKYPFFVLDGNNEDLDDYSSFSISYIADWFEDVQKDNALGKPIKLENQYLSADSDTSVLNLAVSHDKNDLVLVLEYDRKNLTEANAEKFMKMLEYAGNAVLEGEIPDFTNMNI